MAKDHSILKSFSFAFDGVKTAFRREPNFRIHSLIAALTIILAIFLGFSQIEWLILIFTIALVLVLELVNTAVETLVDLVSPEYRKEAKIAKDVMAASVLLSAILAIIVGLFLFVPKIIAY